MSDHFCRLCHRGVELPSFAPGVCKQCADEVGMKPMPPPRRRAAPCSRCNGMTFARSMPREYSGEYDRAYPMTVTQPPRTVEKMFGTGNNVYTPDPRYGAGVLEVYTCLGCGLVEWYCQDPQKIPIGPEHMTD